MMLMGCGKEAQPEMFGLPGAWTMKKVVYPSGLEVDYPHKAQTYCRIFDKDSMFYECITDAISSEVIIKGTDKGKFEVKKVGDRLVYTENGALRPLDIVDDSTIIIQKSGVRSTWRRNREMSERRIEEIRNIVEYTTDERTKELRDFVFSMSERELQTTNHHLVYTLIALLAATLCIVWYTYRTIQRKRQIERQLQHIKEEQELRPQSVAKALQEVENEFLASEYFISLKNRIAEGKVMSSKEWAELEYKMKTVYPAFIRNLSELCQMSEVEWRVCILVKLRFTPSEIAGTIAKDATTVSSIRRRLYTKIFGKRGGSKDWDNFILSL